MARPEKPIAPDAPFSSFARQLRRLRHDAGSPTYSAMSRRIKHQFSVTTLARAASGDILPTLEVTLAYAEACEGSAQHWTEQWLLAQRGVLPRPDGSWAAVPPSASRATSAAGFVEALRQLRLWAGTPSYTQLAGLTGLSRSTLCDALSTSHDRLPSRNVTSRLVLACMQYAWANRTWLQETPQISVTPQQAQHAWMHVWLELSSRELARRTAVLASRTVSPSLPRDLPRHERLATGHTETEAAQEAGIQRKPDHLARAGSYTGERAGHEVQQLASAMQSVFASLEVSMRVYAARVHLDPSVVSRFLSGRRIPPRSFITGLVHEAEQGGWPVGRDAYEELIRLHEAALSSSPYIGDQLSALQARNAEASLRIRELEAQLAELRGR